MRHPTALSNSSAPLQDLRGDAEGDGVGTWKAWQISPGRLQARQVLQHREQSRAAEVLAEGGPR